MIKAFSVIIFVRNVGTRQNRPRRFSELSRSAGVSPRCRRFSCWLQKRPGEATLSTTPTAGRDQPLLSFFSVAFPTSTPLPCLARKAELKRLALTSLADSTGDSVRRQEGVAKTGLCVDSTGCVGGPTTFFSLLSPVSLRVERQGRFSEPPWEVCVTKTTL